VCTIIRRKEAIINKILGWTIGVWTVPPIMTIVSANKGEISESSDLFFAFYLGKF
jgi:hypothetical protein